MLDIPDDVNKICGLEDRGPKKDMYICKWKKSVPKKEVADQPSENLKKTGGSLDKNKTKTVVLPVSNSPDKKMGKTDHSSDRFKRKTDHSPDKNINRRRTVGSPYKARKKTVGRSPSREKSFNESAQSHKKILVIQNYPKTIKKMKAEKPKISTKRKQTQKINPKNLLLLLKNLLIRKKVQ